MVYGEIPLKPVYLDHTAASRGQNKQPLLIFPINPSRYSLLTTHELYTPIFAILKDQGFVNYLLLAMLWYMSKCSTTNHAVTIMCVKHQQLMAVAYCSTT